VWRRGAWWGGDGEGWGERGEGEEGGMVVMGWGWRNWGALAAESRGRWRGRGGRFIFRPEVA